MENISSRNQKKRRTKKNKKIVMVMSVIIVILLVVLLAIGIKQQNNKEDKSETSVEKSNNAELYSDDMKAFKIKTPYCDLFYPVEWEECVQTEIVSNNEGNAVQFWAKLEGKEKVHLFDIVFGGESYVVGTLEVKDEEIITVNVISDEFEADDSWTEDEKNTIYSMIEDVNYILLQLEEVDGYESMY